MHTLTAGVELPSGVTLRRMTAADISAGLALCRASRWNQVARDWEQFLSLEPEGASVAIREGRVIGTVTTLHYGRRFGWIAMVLVDPAERGNGVGRALLLHGLAQLSDVAARLDATPAGEVLYRKLDFTVEYHLTRFQRGQGPPDAGPDPGVTRLDDTDWPEIRAVDERVFGADRSRMLTWLADGAPEYAWVLRSPGGLEGFMLGRHGHSFDHLGPIVASSAAAARRLLSACLARHSGRAFVLDAPDHQAGWQQWLREAGFTVQRPFARMYRGPHVHRGSPDRVFATIGAEFG